MLRITCKFTPAPVVAAGTYSFDFHGGFSSIDDEDELLEALADALGRDELLGDLEVLSAVSTATRAPVGVPAATATPAVPYTPVAPTPPLRPLSTPGYSPVSDGLRSRAG